MCTAHRPLVRGKNATQNPVCVILTKPCALALYCLRLGEKSLWLLQKGTDQPAKFVSTSAPHAHFLLLTQTPYQLIAPCSGPKALTPCSVISTRLPETCLVALVIWIKGFSTGYLNLVSLERRERLFLYPPLSLGKSSRKTSEKETGLPKRGNTARYISKIKSLLQNLTQSLGGAFLGQVSILLVTQHSQGEAGGATDAPRADCWQWEEGYLFLKKVNMVWADPP